MTNQRSNKRQSFPPYDESSKLSRRDQTLVRVEKLLSEQFIVPLPDEAQFEDESPADVVDLEEAVDTAQLPPEARPEPRTFAPTRTPAAAGPAPDSAAPDGRPAGKSRLSLLSATLQAAILIFVLAWVFLLGILIGRGHLWQSGLGHDLIAWVEQKAGWSDKAGPEIVLKKDNQPDEVIPPPTTDEGQSDIDPAVDPAPLETEPAESGDPAEEPDEMPVWDWPGWTPGPSENPLGDSGAAADGADPAPAAETTPAPEMTPTAETTPAPADQPAAVTEAPAEPEEEEYPTALEEDAPGPAVQFQPPGDQDDYDYEAMLEPAEVPDATLAEGSPLPPDLTGVPGTGKFAVQVAQPTEAQEAQSQVKLLISQGFNAYYYENNGRFPVRVGHFATRQEADRAKIQLEELGHKEPYVSSLGN